MENNRFASIMARVDEWDDANAGFVRQYDAAVSAVNFMLNDPIGDLSDDEIFDCACNAWMAAE